MPVPALITEDGHVLAQDRKEPSRAEKLLGAVNVPWLVPILFSLGQVMAQPSPSRSLHRAGLPLGSLLLLLALAAYKPRYARGLAQRELEPWRVANAARLWPHLQTCLPASRQVLDAVHGALNMGEVKPLSVLRQRTWFAHPLPRVEFFLVLASVMVLPGLPTWMRPMAILASDLWSTETSSDNLNPQRLFERTFDDRTVHQKILHAELSNRKIVMQTLERHLEATTGGGA